MGHTLLGNFLAFDGDAGSSFSYIDIEPSKK